MADSPTSPSDDIDDDKIIWIRFVRSVLIGNEMGKPGEPIEVDWEYITGRVNEPRAYTRRRDAASRETA